MTEAREPRSARWLQPRGPGGWTWLDAGVAVLFLAALVAEIAPNPEMTPQAALLVLAVGLTVPMVWRTSHSAVAAVLVCGAELLMCVVSTGPFSPQLAILPVLMMLYAAASRTRGTTALVTGAATLILVVLAWVVTEEGHTDDFWPWMLWAGAWSAGTFVRRRSDLAAEHAGRAALLEVEARRAAADSAQEERDRIARELHDVVAHAVSVMVVQAGAERLRLGADAERTGEVLEAIEDAGRLAMDELRTMLGVLREPSGGTSALDPLPGLAELPGLVERMRSAGLPVTLSGDAAGIGPRGTAAGLAAYRIVQEALTNVMRHAGPVLTTVTLVRTDFELTVTVCSGPPVRAQGSAGSGRGLVGMRERALALKGSFEAGFEPDGGFRVHATLPVPAGVTAR